MVSAGEVGAVVPGPNRFVIGHTLSATGASEEITIRTLADGTISVTWEGDPVLPPGGGIGGPGKCLDDAKNPYNDQEGNHKRWYTTLNWWYKDGSRPSYLPEGEVVDRLQQAVTNITSVNDNCGLSDTISATASYQGRTDKSANMPNGTNQCATGEGDGTSVITFGDAGGENLGTACIWGDVVAGGDDKITESDVRLDKEDYGWTVTPGNCSGPNYSIEAVATHERGHTFGLDHVSESAHGYLTMSAKINAACSNWEASLGLGDYEGLELLY
jgi:hypothetical protein